MYPIRDLVKEKDYLSPPWLSSIIQNLDTIQPHTYHIDEALGKSREYWYRLTSLADAHRGHGLNAGYVNPGRTLHRVPKLRVRPKTTYVRAYGVSPSLVLCMQASSTWKLVGNSDCDTIEKERTSHALLQVGTSVAIPYTFDGFVFNSWIGTTEEKCTGPNYLGILTVGWCYILSARLVEIQGEGATMHHTTSQTESCENLEDPQDAPIIDVGEVDKSIGRWWYAILARHQGWKAIVKQTPRNEYLAPWAVSRTCETRFTINQKIGLLTCVHTPLTSEKAFDVLAKFALLHGLGSQLLIALMTAITIPTHQYYGLTVQLPFPRASGAKQPKTPMDVIPPIWSSLNEELPYYMTLSCSPDVMMSTLCGSFWELGIPCNLVAPWLHPLFNEILDETAPAVGHDYETLALIGAIRRPYIGALWIGAAIGGLAPKIIQKVKSGNPPLDALSFPWTRCLQTFMDIPGLGPYTHGNPEHISRPDVWRLLHLPQTEDDELLFGTRPQTPWEPWGSSLRKDCALRVTSHLKYTRHEYQYHHWNWEVEGRIIQDQGFPPSPLSTITEFSCDMINIKEPRIFPKRELDQLASEDATFYISIWLSINGEGKPWEIIYQDDWLRGVWEEDDGGWEPDEADDRDSKDFGQLKDRVKTWLDLTG
ncbi:unnamed protein product [Penicillium glandicola]